MSDTRISSTVGLRMHRDAKFAGKETRLRAAVGWKHVLESIDANKTMAFAGQTGFTVTGTPLARNTGFIGTEAQVALNRTTAVTFGVNAEFGGKQREHAAYASLHWAY